MATFQGTFGNFVFLGIMIFAGLSLIIYTQATNDAAQPLIEDPLFNDSFASLQTTLSSLEDTGQIQYDQFSEETPQPGFISIVLFGIVSAGKTFGNITVAVFAIIVRLPLLVLGIPQTLFSVVVAWLTITLITTLWILYKVGG